jgi:NOL1/NOP2/sun family putative RNA methylase
VTSRDRSAGGLARYQEIIPDWEGFLTACSRPLPTVLRVNPLKTTRNRLAARLAEQGIDPSVLPWADDLLETEHAAVGRTMEHWLGLFYIQEAVQTLPVRALGPRPGERILDLCAAPGGKTTQIASQMGNRGVLVANEPSGRRHPALLANVNRLGILNTVITAYRGESFPLRTAFDRVLVDAPCSAEGTLRKEPSLRDGAAPRTIARLAAVQRRLITRGYDLLRPGGRLVYSTCTFAPEENEAVVAHLLAARPARVEPFQMPTTASPGLTRWAGAVYPREIGGCKRIYPHQINSGGGFIACITRPA